MLDYTYKICDLFRLSDNCENCPIYDICHERVPIIRQALDDWEKRLETRSKDIYEELMKDEEIKSITACINDNATAKPKHRGKYKKKPGPKPKFRI